MLGCLASPSCPWRVRLLPLFTILFIAIIFVLSHRFVLVGMCLLTFAFLELAELQECQEAKTTDEVALMARLEHLREITETRS